jgi:hypothetical protein
MDLMRRGVDEARSEGNAPLTVQALSGILGA